ncbi:MAG TPA: B12-binding domain-containing radical SAM protein [Clostridiales bacterium]|nr:B12-binding domain-containing radical SAM protein [Clostridiales bacterium]
MEKKPVVLLVAFYNIKALGVRYLETALRRSGYDVATVFFKDFNSLHPKPTNETELKLLNDTIEHEQPILIGFSVMSSMYLDTVNSVLNSVRDRFPNIPTVCGGAFASMFPERFLDMGIDYVIRTDGEIAMCRLADSILNGTDIENFPCFCLKRNGENIINPVGDILEDIDGYGQPAIECGRSYFIEHSAIVSGDPYLSALSYEVIASRGCPFTCSYCCCNNLRRLFPKGTKYVRTRSVKSVINELVEVKKKFKKLVFVHFYDEIFPNTPGWIDEFVKEYKQKINLPFTIWSHPKMVNEDDLRKLVKAGLVEVIMGIQSGSARVRRDIFHRYETQEDIINATRAIKNAGVFWASYDFMLQHPFETIDDLKETYYLIKELRRPFELQLHGLNFLPGTDIVEMAINDGIVTREHMDEIMYAPMAEQFNAYWKQENEPLSCAWYRMIYCLQFDSLKKKIVRFEDDPLAYEAEINALYIKAKKMFKLRYYRKKATIVANRIKCAAF